MTSKAGEVVAIVGLHVGLLSMGGDGVRRVAAAADEVKVWAVPFKDRPSLRWRHPQWRWDDGARIRSLVQEANAGRLIGAAKGSDEFRRDVAVVAFKAQRRSSADPGRRGGVLERPFQSRPRHPRLVGAKRGTFQINPLDCFLRGP